jgi:hypothetical protein
LTGDQHTDHISNKQRVSRHSLPTLLYFLFSPPHIFLIQFYADPQTAHWLLPHPEADPSAKAKEPFFCQRTDKTVQNFLITFYLTK